MFASAFKSFVSNITSNYEVSKQPDTTAGVWTIFKAKKRSDGSGASVFVFDRRSLELDRSNNFGSRASVTSVRKAQDEAVVRLKKEASSLARLRHPSILQLLEPVEETRSGGLMFATEPVICALSHSLSSKDRSARNGRQAYNVDQQSADLFELDELEIQKGLLQVAKGLEFLHQSAKLVHGNLTPDAIFINAKSDWKISGLGFAGPPDNAEGHQSIPQISLSEVLHNDARVPETVQLNLDYSSPDFVIDSNINYAADIFSLGLITVACYRTPHKSPIETHGNQSTYKRIMGSPSAAPGPNNNYGCSDRLSRELENTLVRLLARRPAARMNAVEFQQSEYFDNILVNTMRFLDNLPTKTPAEKAGFLKGLVKFMPQFPVSVLEKKILSVLLDELKDKELLSVILQDIFMIVKMIPTRKQTLATKILPHLRKIFTAQGKSTERDTSLEAGLVVFLEHIQTISENSSAQQFKDDVLPVIHVAMEASTHSLVDAALGTLPIILPVLDFTTVKHDLFPVIANVFAKTSSLGIKVRGLEALGVLCGATDTNTTASEDDFSGTSTKTVQKASVSSLDKFTMQEKVMPLLKGIKTKEPAVMMAALRVVEQIAKGSDIEFAAAEVMPTLWLFALGPLLDLGQFKAYMEVVQRLTQRIQREQIKKLQELATLNGRSDGRERAALSNTNVLRPQTNGDAEEVNFEKLVLGSKIGEVKRDDPFAGALSDGHKLTQNVPSYSWTSASGTSTPAMRVGTLQAQTAPSRSITPDVSMSSFAPLQPNGGSSPWMSNQASSFMQPMQPSAQPGLSTQAPNAWSNTLTPQVTNTSRLQATSYLSSPPPLQRASSGPQTVFSTGMLAPPPPQLPAAGQYQPQQVSRLTPAQTSQPVQPIQAPPKQGLDKYQSLL